MRKPNQGLVPILVLNNISLHTKSHLTFSTIFGREMLGFFPLVLAESAENKKVIINSIKMSNIPFQSIDWSCIEKVKYEGEMGLSLWQTIQFGGLRIRLVEYTSSYLADHWCQKGHIVHCLDGEFITELSTGEKIALQKGETYIVSDNLSSHRSISENGVRLLIIDGDFLK
jgi:hypothetical protein